ncbi:MAG: hypothetical protein ABSH48_08110 [Verrucomicrobiota bacterium]
MRWPTDIKIREQARRLQQAGRALLTRGHGLGARAWYRATVARSSGRMEAGVWASRLQEEKDSLSSLARGMETEFLATGNGLEDLARQLGENQKECQSLTDLTLGQTQDAAVQFAFQLLKKAEDLVLASYDQYDHVFAMFNELQQRLAQASQQRDELMRVLLPLSFITMSFRIEASRHPVEVQQAFFTLSDHVNRTVHDVRSTMERQFDELAASERIAHSLMRQISGSIQEHRKKVTITLAATRAQLGALSQALIRSGAGATDLSQRNQAVTGHINGIVMALQCQDITRQRIEHVGGAMDEMRAHLGAGRAATPATDAQARQFVFQAGQIQLQQVQSMFDQLNQAADSLKSGIQSLRTEVGAAAELAVKVCGATLDAKVNRQCQAGVDEILSIVKQAVQKIAGIVSAFEPLQASFVDCTAKATALAGDVRLAGLNAQVFAIRTPAGATLEVLAGRVNFISEDVIEHVARMGGVLSHASEMVNNLRQRLEDFQILGQAEQAVLSEESALSMKKLADLESAIPVQIRGVTQRQETFAASVEKVMADIQFPVTVAQARLRSSGFFQDLVAWGGAAGPASLDETAASQRIDSLKSKYTMESERQAHATALQPALAPASSHASESSIELFDDFSASPAPRIADPSGEVPPPSERPEDPPRPAELMATKISPPTPTLPVAQTKPAASGDLGDNVELF